MNVFQILIAPPHILSTSQQALQRALRTFIITVVMGTLAEVGVLLQQKPALDTYSLSLLIIYAVLVVVGHAIEPVLLQQGYSATDASAIATNIETAATTIQTLEKKDQAQ